MDKDTAKSTFNEVLNQLPFENFCTLIKETGTDRYVKKLFAKLLYIMFVAQIAQVESIRALTDRVKNDTELQDNLNLYSISASQLSRRLKEMSSDFWGTVFTQVAKNCNAKNHQSFKRYP